METLKQPTSSAQAALVIPWKVGDWVRTTNGTSRVGRVQWAEWHRGASRAMYFVEVDGKPISRRYYSEDLELVSE